MKKYSAPDYKSNFTQNFTYLRKHLGISKRKMAELSGISVSSVTKIENGEIPPKLSIEILFEIEKYFGILPADLLCKCLEDK